MFEVVVVVMVVVVVVIMNIMIIMVVVVVASVVVAEVMIEVVKLVIGRALVLVLDRRRAPTRPTGGRFADSLGACFSFVGGDFGYVHGPVRVLGSELFG